MRIHTTISVDDYEISAAFSDRPNPLALLHVKQILLSSFVNNAAPTKSGDILAFPTKRSDNKSGGSPYVP